MVERKTIWHVFFVIMFSVASLALGLAIALLFTPMLVQFLLRDVSYSEFVALGGELGPALITLEYIAFLFPLLLASAACSFTLLFIYMFIG